MHPISCNCDCCQRQRIATLKAQARIARNQARLIPAWREAATARAERLEAKAAILESEVR